MIGSVAWHVILAVGHFDRARAFYGKLLPSLHVDAGN
jgi:hypothetical protein